MTGEKGMSKNQNQLKSTTMQAYLPIIFVSILPPVFRSFTVRFISQIGWQRAGTSFRIHNRATDLECKWHAPPAGPRPIAKMKQTGEAASDFFTRVVDVLATAGGYWR
jgi:hypothetical protein